MTRRRVVISGATGFVGRPVVDALLARGDEVHALIRQTHRLPASVCPHFVNLLDHEAVRSVVQDIGATHMIHLAWDVTPGAYWTSPNNLDWVAASLALYRAFAGSGGKRLLVAGTCAEYEWSDEDLSETTTALRPATLYGAAKDALRRLLEASATLDTLSLGWGRLFFLYGPNERPNRLVASVARALLCGEMAHCGSGAAQRDFMHVGDAASALVATLDSDHRGAVNIASGNCVPMRKVIETLAQLAGRADLVVFADRANAAAEPPRLAASTAILEQAIGFRPRFDLNDGLADTLGWWRNALAMRPAGRADAI